MKSIADAFAKLRRLTGRERSVLVQAWVLLLLADFALRVVPFTTILRYCRHRCEPGERHQAELPIPALRIAWLVERAGRYCPAGTSCLKEALVLSRLLARRGIPTQLRIGVGHQTKPFAAHAWLEQDGRVILGDGEIDAYARLI